MTTPRWYTKAEADVDLAGKVDVVTLETQVASKVGTGGVLDAAIDALAATPIGTERTRAEAAEALLVPLTQKGAASGVATLDGGGKIPASQIPALVINEVYTVASQAAMLALAANVGDVAVRSDLVPAETFMLSALPASTLGNWTQITTAGAVTSVVGSAGTVTGAQIAADPALTGEYAPLVSAPLTGNPTINGFSAVAVTTDSYGGIHLYANGAEL